MIYAKVPIRKGFGVQIDEKSRYESLKKLEELGIVTLGESTWQPCSNKSCPNSIRVDDLFRSERWTVCNSCGKTVGLTHDLTKKWEISKVNFGGIVDFSKSLVQETFPHDAVKFDKSLNAWTVTQNGKIVPVFISQISSYNKFMDYKFDSAWISILLDWDIESSALTYYDQVHFLDFWDLVNKKVGLKQIVKDIASSYETNPSFAIESRFITFLNSVKPGEFEKDFIDTFFDQVKRNENMLREFLGFLSRRKETILNSKIVSVGGAANPDFYSFDLLEYLQDGFKPNKVGEAKRYNLSEFTYDDFSIQFTHADGADTLSVVSTNEVSPSVWRFVWDHSDNGKRFHHVVFDRDLIIMLMNVLGIADQCFATTKVL